MSEALVISLGEYRNTKMTIPAGLKKSILKEISKKDAMLITNKTP